MIFIELSNYFGLWHIYLYDIFLALLKAQSLSLHWTYWTSEFANLFKYLAPY